MHPVKAVSNRCNPFVHGKKSKKTHNSIKPIKTQKTLRNCAIDFVEICNVYVGKTILKADNRIFNSDKIYRSYSDLNFGVTFLEHSV